MLRYPCLFYLKTSCILLKVGEKKRYWNVITTNKNVNESSYLIAAIQLPTSSNNKLHEKTQIHMNHTNSYIHYGSNKHTNVLLFIVLEAIFHRTITNNANTVFGFTSNSNRYWRYCFCKGRFDHIYIRHACTIMIVHRHVICR